MTYVQITILQVTMAVIVYAIIAKLYVWPRLQKMSVLDALIPLLLLHAFRYIGLMFLVPSVVGDDVPSAWAIPTAYADLATSVLAILAVLALHYRNAAGIPLAWFASLVGMADFLQAYPRAILGEITVGAAYYIPILFNPAMFVSYFMIYKLLISGTRKESSAPSAPRI